jgi:hypothetical protein
MFCNIILYLAKYSTIWYIFLYDEKKISNSTGFNNMVYELVYIGSLDKIGLKYANITLALYNNQ